MPPAFALRLRLRLALACLALIGLLLPRLSHAADRPIRVLVWDERQPKQKEAYSNWLGNAIAAHLQSLPGLSVKSTCLDDPNQGLADLDSIDVLVWWGHVRQMEIEPPTARGIVDRIKAGRLSLVALHSAHWSRPFVEAMHERARQDALAALDPSERAGAVLTESELFPRALMAPKYTDRLSPSVQYRKPSKGPVEIRLVLPNCCFPAYRGDGKPSSIRVLRPDHPIARGLPARFEIPQTEMYDEPFHVPAPDEVVLEERWESGEWFRSGAIWKVGAGRVFYFRPGHESYPVYRDPNALKVVENAVRWLGEGR